MVVNFSSNSRTKFLISTKNARAKFDIFGRKEVKFDEQIPHSIEIEFEDESTTAT